MDVCDVCGLSEFTAQDGGYYCDECGTKLQHKRELAEDPSNVIGQQIRTKPKVQFTGSITSWEQINYMLHGLTQRLVELGAPADFRLTALQLWCAYLRYREVAFFSKRVRHRPHVRLKSHKSDLEILFNRKATGRSRRVKRFDSNTDRQRRELSKSVLEMETEELAQSQQSDLETTMSALSNSMQSSSTAALPPLNFRFNSRTRKHLKEKLHLTDEHIEWHEEEAPLDAKCHSILYHRPGGAGIQDPTEWTASRNTILIAILALALNQHRTPILMMDLVRWIQEGHLPFYNLTQYVPEGLDPACRTETIEQLATGYQGLVYCRRITSMMGADLGVIPIEPDLVAIAERFLRELALPLDLLPFVRKLIAIAPPVKRTRLSTYFPSYELHAMKYVLFVMKLLFGLDGAIEARIDAAAIKINERLTPACAQPKLFVWDEWQRYVAMRSVILEQLHYPTCHFRNRPIVNRPVDTELFLDFFASRLTPDDGSPTGHQSVLPRPAYKPARARLSKNMHALVACADKSRSREGIAKRSITFGHTLHPHRDYLAEVLRMDDEDRQYVHIPEYMRADHCARTVAPFINPMALKSHLLTHDRVRLAVQEAKLSCKHMRMAKYNSHRSGIQVFLAYNKLCDVIEVEDSDDSDEGISEACNIMDYIDAREAARELSPEELFHKTMCQNALDELEADLRRSLYESGAKDAAPFRDNPPVNEPLPGERGLLSETVPIVLPNFHYWAKNGYLAHINQKVFEHEYLSTFPPSFQFLLREAAYVTHCSAYALYCELNELEKYFFKSYKRIK